MLAIVPRIAPYGRQTLCYSAGRGDKSLQAGKSIP